MRYLYIRDVTVMRGKTKDTQKLNEEEENEY